jgi:hypothetical protein
MSIDYQSKQKSKSSLSIVILLICLIGVLVYMFFFFRKDTNEIQLDNVITEESSDDQSNKKNVADVIDLLKYPHAKHIGNVDNVTETQIRDFIMETEDSIDVVYNYYISMSSDNKWSLGLREIAPDEKSGVFSIREKYFTADIFLEKVELKQVTKIRVNAKTGFFDLSEDYDYTKYVKKNVLENNIKQQQEIDYMIHDSHERIVNQEELSQFSEWELKIARNEIYARHGREFVHQDLQCYFDLKKWYTKNPNFQDIDLSSIEITNISIILDYEKQTESSLMDKDMGC